MRWMKREFFLSGLMIVSVLAMAVACGSDSAESMSGDNSVDGDAPMDGDSPDGDDPDGDDPDGDDPDGDDPYTPEQEIEIDVSRPVTSNDYLFVINPATGNLVAIASDTLVIHTLSTGSDPIAIQVLPETNTALIIDRTSDRLVMAQPDEDRTASWALDPDKTAGYNMISCAPNGLFAIVYFNSQLAGNASSAYGSLQSVGLVDMRDPSDLDELDSPILPLTVGLNPTAVHWKNDGSKAFVITDQGATIIDLGNPDSPEVTPNIPLEAVSGPSLDREVLVTADGRYALVRRIETAELRMVDFENGEVAVLELDAPPTDLDLLPDDSRAIITLRETHQLLVVSIPGGFADAEAVDLYDIPEGIGVAEPAADNNTIALYSTLNNTRNVWIFSLDDESLNSHNLIKRTQALSFAPPDSDGVLRLLVLHKKNQGDAYYEDDYYDTIDRSYGYSVLDLATGMTVLQLTDAHPAAFTFTGDGAKGYLSVAGSGTRQVHIMDLKAAGGARIIEMDLSSTPTSLGLMADGRRMYVAQDHPDGRITFIDTVTDEPVTITGFELNGQID